MVNLMIKKLIFFPIVFLVSLGILFISITNFMNWRYPINREELNMYVSLLSNNIECFEPLSSYIDIEVTSENLISWELDYHRNSSCVIKNIPILINMDGIKNYKIFFDKVEDGTLKRMDITEKVNKTSPSTLFIKINEEEMGIGQGIKAYIWLDNTFSNFYRIFTDIGTLNIEFIYDRIFYNCDESCLSFYDTKITEIQPILKVGSVGAKEIRTNSDRIVIRFNPENAIIPLLQLISIPLLIGSFFGILNSLTEKRKDIRNRPEEFL